MPLTTFYNFYYAVFIYPFPGKPDKTPSDFRYALYVEIWIWILPATT